MHNTEASQEEGKFAYRVCTDTSVVKGIGREYLKQEGKTCASKGTTEQP